ncbi:MAG: NUDIX hydrolase [Thermoleophilaceae bacterium]|nr:NUDIX hydrolase [Thermoleophilaceae bacterium]
MRFDAPPPGEELNLGEVTEPRAAASLILLRDSDGGPEVLLVERNPEQRFMGGAWVFPGGALHAEDASHAGAAVRELAEEAGIALPSDAELVPFSRWITPAEVKVRFDTWFFVARSPAGARAIPDGAECVDAQWLRPADALAAHRRDQLMLVFPTIKHLEQLRKFETVAGALDAARGRTVEPVQPRVVVRDGAAELLLPGEPGYDDA